MAFARIARGTWTAALIVVVVAVVALVAVARSGGPGDAAGTFIETFDGAPASPQPYAGARVAVTRTERNLSGDVLQPAHHSMHGADCAGPPATFTNDGSHAMAVYQCRDHIMTSISGTPYGVVYLTPAALADWSAGPATITWAQSTARSSARDFLSVWVTPWADVLDVPAPAAVDADLNGAPLNAFHLELDLFTDRITPEAYINGVRTFYRESNITPFSRVVAPDNARRDTFALTITASSVVLTLNNTVIMRGDGLTLPFSSGMVQFGHHAYSPGKGCSAPYVYSLVNQCVDGSDIQSSNTWHWDNFAMLPALPASFLQGTPDYTGSSGGHVSLAGVTQSGSRLRFNAIGRVELSFDGGRTWSVAPIQPGNQERDPYHVSNYWVPVPAGVSGFDIRLSADGSYPAHMIHAKDFTVWAAAAGALATPVASTPTAAPTATATARAATATATATAAATATATAQPATATATATVRPPTATPTAIATARPATATATATAVATAAPTRTPTPAATAPPRRGCDEDRSRGRDRFDWLRWWRCR